MASTAPPATMHVGATGRSMLREHLSHGICWSPNHSHLIRLSLRLSFPPSTQPHRRSSSRPSQPPLFWLLIGGRSDQVLLPGCRPFLLRVCFMHASGAATLFPTTTTEVPSTTSHHYHRPQHRPLQHISPGIVITNSCCWS